MDNTSPNPDPSDIIAALTAQRDRALSEALLWECEARRLHRENLTMRDALSAHSDEDAAA